MSSYTGISPKNPSKYVGPAVYISSIVSRNREPTGADYRQPETGKLYPIGSYWIISKDPTTGTEGDLWYLSKIVANVAYWLQISSGGSGTLVDIEVDAVTAPGVNPVTPILGQIDFHGAVVANHSVPVETRSRALHNMNLEVQYATSAAATDGTKSGLAHFDSSMFTVDASGFVSLSGGGAAIDSIAVDASTPPGTNPVLPNGLGVLTVTGGQVAAGTTVNVIRTVSLAANTYTVQIQRSSSQATTTIGANGVSHFNSNDFSVDANGFVSLADSQSDIGQTIGLQTINLSTIPLGAAGTYFFESRVAAYEATGPNAGGFSTFTTIRTNGATATLIGDTDSILHVESAIMGVVVEMIASGNSAILQVTGVVGLTINWAAETYYTYRG